MDSQTSPGSSISSESESAFRSKLATENTQKNEILLRSLSQLESNIALHGSTESNNMVVLNSISVPLTTEAATRSVTFAHEDSVKEFESIEMQSQPVKSSRRFRGGSAVGMRGSALENDDSMEVTSRSIGSIQDPSQPANVLYFNNAYPLQSSFSPIALSSSLDRNQTDIVEFHRLSTTIEADEYITDLKFVDLSDEDQFISRSKSKKKKNTDKKGMVISDRNSNDKQTTVSRIRERGNRMDRNEKFNEVKLVSNRLRNRREKKKLNRGEHQSDSVPIMETNPALQSQPLDLSSFLYCQPITTPRKKLIYYKLKKTPEKPLFANTGPGSRPWRSPVSPGRPGIDVPALENHWALKTGIVSDPARVSRLATPTQGKFERKPEPPRYCIDYPLLPLDGVDRLHEIANKFATIPDHMERMRFCVSVNIPKGFRNEYNPPNESFQLKRTNLIEKKPSHVKVDIRKYHSRLSEKTMSSPKDLAQYQFSEFSKKLSVGFTCVVLDSFMQVMGSYDCSMGHFMPGLVLSPPFLSQKIAKTKLSFSRANLLEIEFSKLPPDAFAVVPVFIDESYIHPLHKSLLPTAPTAAGDYAPDPTAISMNCDIFFKTNDPKHGLRASSGVVSDLSKEEAEKFLPQDFIMAQCDGVEGLWYKIASKKNNDSKLVVQRILRLIARRLKTRSVVGHDSFLTEEQVNPPQNANANPDAHSPSRRNSLNLNSKEPAYTSWWTHYSEFTVLRSFRCDPKVLKSGVSTVVGGSSMPPRPQSAPWRPPSGASAQGPNSVNSRRGSTSSGHSGTNTGPAAVSMKRMDSNIPAHLLSMNENMTPHPSTQTPKLQRSMAFQKPQAEIPDFPDDETHSNFPTFGIGDAFAPFVLFRKSSHDPSWALLPVLSKISNCQQRIEIICQHITELLVNRGILPFHCVHVEHCINCADHQLTTRHIPGQYEDNFVELRNEIKSKLPPTLIFSNLSGIAKSPPEVGSFEVSVRPYNTAKTTLIYSKISKCEFPSPADIIERLSELLLPEVIHFKEQMPSIDAFILDGYSKRPLVGATVALCRVNTMIGMKSVPLENYQSVVQGQFFSSKGIASGHYRALNSYSGSAIRLIKSSSLGSITTNSDSDHEIDHINEVDMQKKSQKLARNSEIRGRSGKGLSSKLPEAASLSGKDRSPSPGERRLTKKVVVPEPVIIAAMQAAAKPKRATSPDDSKLRHSMGFAKVRAWSIIDVDAWFYEHGASPELLSRAKASGVVDGASLLKLLTAKNLEAWGLRNRLQILRFIKGLAGICAGNNLQLREALMNCNVNMSFEQFSSTLRAPSPSFSSGLAHQMSNGPAGQYDVIPQYDGIRIDSSTASPVECSVIATANTDNKGVVKFSCEYSGNYFLRISHPMARDIYSHTFRVSNDSNIVHSIALKPRLALVMVVIKFASLHDLDEFHNYSFLSAFLNTKSGIRHIVLSEYWATEYVNNEFLFIGERWLPVGHYICGVTGDQVVIDQPSRESNGEWRDWVPAYYEQYPLDKVIFSYKSTQALRTHRTLIHKAIYSFQNHYRMARRKRNLSGIHHIVTAQAKVRRFAEYIRRKLRIRCALTIQKSIRALAIRKKYLKLKSALAKLQGLWRGVLLRKKISGSAVSGALYFVSALNLSSRATKAVNALHTISIQLVDKSRSTKGQSPSMILDAIRAKRLQACIIIQCAYRLYLERMVIFRRINEKIAKAVLLRFVHEIYRVKMNKIKELKRIYHRECLEIALMANEEKRIRRIIQHDKDIKALEKKEERRKIEEKAKKLEIHRKVLVQRRIDAAIRIQTCWRRYCAIIIRIRLRKAMFKLQKFFRNTACRRKIMRQKKRKLQEKEKLSKRKKSIFTLPGKGFSSRLKHAVASGRKSILGRRTSTVNTLGIMRKVVEKHVIKIQSMLRMRLARKRYIAKRRALGQRHVPLYRKLIPKSPSPHDEVIAELPVENVDDDDQSTITDYSEIRRNHTLVGKFKKQGEALLSLGASLTSKALQLKAGLQSYLQKRHADKLKKQQDQFEEQSKRRLRGIIRFQAAVRGGMTRHRLYCEKEMRLALKKIILPNATAEAAFLAAKSKLLIDSGILPATVCLPTESPALRLSSANDANIATSSSLSAPKTSGDFDKMNPNSARDIQDSKSKPVLGRESSSNERFRPAIVDGLSLSIAPLTAPERNAAADPKAQSQSVDIVDQDNLDNESSWSSNLTKTVSKATSKLTAKLIDGVIATTGALQAAKEKAIEATSDYLLRQRLTAERESRKKLGQVILTDALLNIRGTLVVDLPTVDRKWYIKVFPKASYTRTGVEVDNVTESWRDIVPDLSIETESAVGATLSQLSMPPQQTAASEAAQTMTLTPFSLESVHDASFFVHLTDLTRYKSVEIVIFIESDASSLAPKSSAEEGELYRDSVDGIPTSAEDGLTLPSGVKQEKKFVPVFYGECFLGRGATFGPQGGRMNVKLVPNNFQVLRMPHGRRLQALGGLELLVTLLPVAIPSSLFLRSFRRITRPAPCYPSTLVDCERIEAITINWDAFYGGAVCVSSFGKRILVSTRRKGAPKGLAEFDTSGKFVGHAYDAYKELGSVVLMVSGMKHVACCGSTGFVMIIREDRNQQPTSKHGNLLYPWGEPLFINAFETSVVVCGCAFNHADLDFFFVVSKSNEICVAVIENGECFRSAVNDSFISSPIKSIQACAPFLYLGTAAGDVYVLNLLSVLDGDIELVGYLHRLLSRQESIFTSNAGISTMAVIAPNAFLGLKCEDEHRKDIMKKSRYLANPKDDRYQHDHVEGHLLLIGGNDASPVIKVMQPHAGGMREVVTLTGHTEAITHICADAAGRSIVSASAGERRIIFWDGFSFTCERLIDEVNIGSLCLGEDCMLISSQKAPFLRMWGAPEPSRKPRVLDKYVNEQELKCRQIESECNIRYTDISVIRTPEWCFAMLKGGFKPKKSIALPAYLDPVYVQVIWRWAHQYQGSRLDAPDSQLQIRQRSMDRHQRVRNRESAPGTPAAIRRGETPRARARRRFEKDQIGTLQDLTDLHSRPITTEGDLYQSPIKESTTKLAPLTETHGEDNNDDERRGQMEDDSLILSPFVDGSNNRTLTSTVKAEVGDTNSALSRLQALLQKPSSSERDECENEDYIDGFNRLPKPINNKHTLSSAGDFQTEVDSDESEDDEPVLTSADLKHNHPYVKRASDFSKKAQLARIKQNSLSPTVGINNDITLPVIGKRSSRDKIERVRNPKVDISDDENSDSSLNNYNKGNKLFVPERFQARIVNLKSGEGNAELPGKAIKAITERGFSKPYRVQFGTENDSDDDHELETQLEQKKLEIIKHQEEKAKMERRNTLRPRVIEHLNDIED